ncbi:pilus assembly protein PilP [Halomonas sp. 328]|uniref:pilus assembly protein PilP n=1 Tax=Halomonas sp. 328 TaxID=2776704 RepID=UPI001E3D1413|nr:pilus assembly protein PilP [Halomonas sp. 328]
MNSILARGGGLLLLITLVGCGDPDIAGLDRQLAEIRANPGRLELSPLPDTPGYVAISYDQADRRSPFMARLPEPEGALAGGSEDLAPDMARAREPLERYPLDRLALVGTLSVGGQPSALVRAPDGEVHRLRNGNYLGTDFGRIVSITEASVQLVEVVPNGRGGWIERVRSLSLNGEGRQRG